MFKKGGPYCFFWFLLLPFSFALEDTLPRGGIRFKFTAIDLDAENYLNSQDQSVPVFLANELADYELGAGGFELEYAWAENLTWLFRTGYQRRELKSIGNSIRSAGIPAIYIGLRQRLNPRGGSTRLMAESGVRIPLEADVNEPLPLGSEGFDWVGIASYNQDFFPTRGGFEMDFGYRFRNKAPGDEIFFDTKLKLGFLRVARADILYQVVESTGSQEDFDALVHPDRRGYQRLGLELSRILGKHWQGSLGYHDTFRGKNQFETSGWNLSFTWRN